MTIEELQNSLEAHEQLVLEIKNSKKIVEQVLQARTSQNKNKSRGGLSKRSRGGIGGGRNKDSHSQDNDVSNTSKKIIISAGEEINTVAEEERILTKGRCNVIIVTSLVITLMSVVRVTIQR